MGSTDRRVQRTHQALHEALMSLVLEVPYEQITVQQILDRANVGRSTFYTHFQDKDDLLVRGMEHLRTEIAEAQRGARPGAPASETLLQFSRTLFEHTSEFRKVYRALVTTSVWPFLRQRVQNMVADLIRRECADDLKRIRKSGTNLPPELFVHFLASTLLSVMTWWLDHRNSLSPREIDEVYRKLVTPTIGTVLG